MTKKIACGCKIIHNIRVPAGFCFDPSDEDLIHFYLKSKNSNEQQPDDDYVSKMVKEVDFYAQSPDELAAMYSIDPRETHYFFTRVDLKHSKGDRVNRLIKDGYWRISGVATPVEDNKAVIGTRRSLNFFRGKPPRGEKTKWIMQEFVLVLENPPIDAATHGSNKKRDGWVLCKLYTRDDPKAKNNNKKKKDEAQTISGPGLKFETGFHTSDSDVIASSNIEQPYRLSSDNVNPGVEDNILGYGPNINYENKRYKQTKLYDASQFDELNKTNASSRCDLPIGAGDGNHENLCLPSLLLVDSGGFALESQEDKFDEQINPLQSLPITNPKCDELSDANLRQPNCDEFLDWDWFNWDGYEK